MRDENNSYREADFQHTCAICKKPAAQRCLQCARTYCALHGPGSAATLCADCTLELENQRAPVRSTKTGLSMALGVGGVVCSVLFGPVVLAVAGAGVLVTQGIGAGIERRIFSRFRRRKQLESDDDFLLEDPRLARDGGDAQQQRQLGVGRRGGGKRAMDARHYRKTH
jgi:hypothetical protein